MPESKHVEMNKKVSHSAKLDWGKVEGSLVSTSNIVITQSLVNSTLQACS